MIGGDNAVEATPAPATGSDPVLERLAATGVVLAGPPEVEVSGGVGAHLVREFLARNRVPFAVADGGTRLVCKVNGHPEFEEPTLEQLGAALGLVRPPLHEFYDLVIIGGGPAGLAAAVYGASEGLSTVVVERFAAGGQAGSTSRIENYLGFPDGISGAELSDRARAQAVRLGAEFLLLRSVSGGGTEPNGLRVELSDGATVVGRTLLACSGVDWRRLDLDGVDDLIGRGIYYGAAVAEAPGLDGKDIYIIGGGNSAGQAAVFFSSWARSVTLLVRGDGLAKSMSSYLIEQIRNAANVSISTGTSVVGVHGTEWLAQIDIADTSGTTRVLDAHALFVCIGGEARTDWADGVLARDANGYLLTGSDLALAPPDGPQWQLDREPLALETTTPGLFAAGDVRHGSTKRVSTAVGEGAMAVTLVHRYLQDHSGNQHMS